LRPPTGIWFTSRPRSVRGKSLSPRHPRMSCATTPPIELLHVSEAIMALTDSAVVVPGTGHIYIAPVATAVPSDPSAPAAPWVEIGHTSRDEGLTITRSGGDSEVLGSWQNPSLRERRDPTTWAVTFQLLQVDAVNFELY